LQELMVLTNQLQAPLVVPQNPMEQQLVAPLVHRMELLEVHRMRLLEVLAWLHHLLFVLALPLPVDYLPRLLSPAVLWHHSPFALARLSAKLRLGAGRHRQEQYLHHPSVPLKVREHHYSTRLLLSAQNLQARAV
jgi:hypothetical protein